MHPFVPIWLIWIRIGREGGEQQRVSAQVVSSWVYSGQKF